MKKAIQEIAGLVLVLTMALIGICTGTENAQASPPPAIEGGKIGNLQWFLSPEGVVTISGTGALASCKNVGSAAAPIYRMPWYHPEKIKKIVVGEGITSIGTYALHAPNVTEIVLPSTVTKVGKFACFGDKKLTTVTIPAGSKLRTIGERAFEQCTSLKQIYLPDSVTAIGEGAFTKTGLTSFRVPAGVKTIPSMAFRDTRSLQEINLPASVVKVKKYAFYGSGLTAVAVRNPKCAIGQHSGTIPAKVIWGYSGSTAQKYAKKYGRTFKVIPGATTTPQPTRSPQPGGKVEVSKVTITKAPKTIKAGSFALLKATVSPSNATKKGVVWKISNKKYAAIKGGILLAKKAGKGKTVKITATAKDGSKKKATVRVKIK